MLKHPAIKSVDPMIGTLLLNPIMGHIQVCCTSPIIYPGLQSSLRYDFNLHSFDADLVGALLFRPLPHQQIRLRGSWRHGLALSVESSIADGVKLEFGIATGSLDRHILGVEGSIPRPAYHPTPSIGLTLSIEPPL